MKWPTSIVTVSLRLHLVCQLIFVPLSFAVSLCVSISWWIFHFACFPFYADTIWLLLLIYQTVGVFMLIPLFLPYLYHLKKNVYTSLCIFFVCLNRSLCRCFCWWVHVSIAVPFSKLNIFFICFLPLLFLFLNFFFSCVS